MHNPSPSRLFGIVAILIFLALVILTLGTGNLSHATLENKGTASASNRNAVAYEVIGVDTGVDGLTLSPTRSPNTQELQSGKPSNTPPFFPTGTYNGLTGGTTTDIPATISPLPGEYSPDVVLVKIDPALAGNTFKQCLNSVNASVGSQIKEIDVLRVIVPKGEVTKATASLSECPGVSYAEPDYIATTADTIPNDPAWVYQYGLVAIHAPQGWDDNTGSPSVTIAIVDTGVDLTHPDLAGKIVPGYDFVNSDNIPQDDNGHGTHVAGIAAAITNNGIGVAGVSWGARIMPVKVLDASGSGSIDNVALGIIWAAENGADVINLSLGCGVLTCPTLPLTLEAAVNFAYGKGVTLVAAAGNLNSDFVYYPARLPHVIAVAATDQSNHRWLLSNFGPEVDVSAPGSGIYSTYRGNIYSYLSGTSMSTAFVSGLAAILRGLPNYSSPDQVTGALETSALDLGTPGRDDLYGFGLIQVDAAINAFQATPTPTFTPTSTPHANNPASALVLPATGFTPRHSTILPIQPNTKTYTDLGDLWLEIPLLQVEIPIVGVPLVGNAWDVSWLGDQAGWLNGTAFPTHAGNSVISAHVYDASGNPGPFVRLNSLVWGDQVIVHAFGQEYVYSVRESVLARPGEVSSVIRYEEYPWLTLITCQGYDEVSNTYRTRVVVRAVQVEIK